jgi:hypothetical protein
VGAGFFYFLIQLGLATIFSAPLRRPGTSLTRSHALRGNAVFDAPRRLGSTLGCRYHRGLHWRIIPNPRSATAALPNSLVSLRWLPTLTRNEITVVESYYLQHMDELDEYESRVRAHRAEQIRLQRLRFPERERTSDQRLAELRQLLRQRRGGTSDEGACR